MDHGNPAGHKLCGDDSVERSSRRAGNGTVELAQRAASATTLATAGGQTAVNTYNQTGNWQQTGAAAQQQALKKVPEAALQGALLGGLGGYAGALTTANNPLGLVNSGGSNVGAWDESQPTNTVNNAPRSGRGANNLRPDSNAQGSHTTFKTDPITGKVTNYRIYAPNANNPSGYDEVLGYAGVGKPHFNKVTEEFLMPHVHDRTAPGWLRAPYLDEIPR